VSVDVAKERYVVGLGTGGVVSLVMHFIVSQQAGLFLALLAALAAAGKRVAVVLESTGTYGDWLRGQAQARGWSVLRVQSKHAHDFTEVQDGLPGKHDAKDVRVLATLHALGRP
jgi:transposase